MDKATQEDDFGDVLVDALPYIDRDNDSSASKKAVRALIREEMERGPPPDMEAILSKVSPSLALYDVQFEHSPVLQEEWARMKRGEEMENIDEVRYSVQGPYGVQQKNPEAWKACVKNSEAQLAHQSVKLENLALLSRYGAGAWVTFNEEVEKRIATFEADISRLKDEIDLCNRRRKAEQVAAGKKLKVVEEEWANLCAQCVEIQHATAVLKAERKQLREQLGEPEEEHAEKMVEDVD